MPNEIRFLGYRFAAGAAALWVVLGGSPATAATYYVRAGGDDKAAGTSPSTAWATVARVSSAALKTGDRVLFHEGDRFTGQLIVRWGGSPSQKAVVGAYYLANGVPQVGYRTARPIIDGEDKVPSKYDGLVRVRYDNVRIENLAFVNSEGRAIDVIGDNDEVSGCYTENSFQSGIHFLRSEHGVIRNNIVKEAARVWPETGGVWSGAIDVVATSDTLVAGNRVEGAYGEGIGVNGGSARNIIEQNYLYAVRSAGIYLDAAPDATVRHNIVVGTTDSRYWRSADSVGGGIALNNELYHYTASTPLPPDVQTTGAKVYDNLVAFTSPGIAIRGEFDQSSFDDVLIFNNTLVDNDTQVWMSSRPKPRSMFINNILLSLSSGTRDVTGTNLNGMTAKANYFSQGDPGGDYTSSTNRYTGLSLARMSGWRTVQSASQIKWSDFTLQTGSVGQGTGDDTPLRMADTTNTFDHDFNRAAHNSPMDLGALRYSPVPYRKPMSIELAVDR